jgi:hypothetical protein
MPSGMVKEQLTAALYADQDNRTSAELFEA